MRVQRKMEFNASGSLDRNLIAGHGAKRGTATLSVQKPLPRICRNTGKGPFSCIECDKVFKSPQIWKIHILNHSYSSKSYKFEESQIKSGERLQCNSTSAESSKPILKKTELKKLPQKNQPKCSKRKAYGCDECFKFFASKQSMEAHINNHNGLRPYKCPVLGCNATYTYVGSLWNHTTSVHKSRRPLECRATPSLQKYKFEDGKVRKDSYNCTDCSNIFTSSKELKMHLNLHEGSKPYKCQYENCGAAFKYAGAFMNHKRFVHGQEVKSRCSECKAVFKERTSLQKHIRILHNTNGTICSSSVSMSPVNKGVRIEKSVVMIDAHPVRKKGKRLFTTLQQGHLLSNYNQRMQGCDIPGTLEESDLKPELKKNPSVICEVVNNIQTANADVERSNISVNYIEDKENQPKCVITQTWGLIHSSENSFLFKCEACNDKFKQCTDYIEHVKNHETFSGQCDEVLCNAEYDVAKSCHFCGKCSSAFQDRKALYKHLLVHAAERA